METAPTVLHVLTDHRLLIIALISVASFCLSLVAFIVSQKKVKKELDLLRVKTAVDLHEYWWREDLFLIRREVGKLVNEWSNSNRIEDHYYMPQQTKALDSRSKIGRLGNFFADLNLMIDEGLICEKTVYRLFGESQLYWFLPFFQALEKERKKKTNDPLPRWFKEVYQLSKKLDKYREE